VAVSWGDEGGLDFVIVKIEPPELQIRIFFVTVVPAWTSPNAMWTGLLLSHPPSDVEISMLTMGWLPADAARSRVSIPPSDHTVTKLAYWPAVEVLNIKGMTSSAPGASVEPVAGKLVAVNPIPTVVTPSLRVRLKYGPVLPSEPVVASCQANPLKVRVLFPMFLMEAAPARPLRPAAVPRIKPPKSTSAGEA
jgi:hypothetical protein